MDIQDAIKIALDGDAILFTGSGFSTGAKNQKNEKLKTAGGLCDILCNEIGIEYDDDLGYVTEKYIDKKSESELIEVLQSEYIISSVSKSHEDLMKINWKRIYTTNYDDVIEKASDKLGKYRLPITLSTEPYKIVNKKNLVVHINGYIKNLTPDKLYNEFKLSRESYLNDDFLKSDWLWLFRQDIKSAKAVFFIGYSLNFDIDIQKILIQNMELKDKCFFITKNDEKQKVRDIMNKFGKVIDTGLESFAEETERLSGLYSPVEKLKTAFSCFKYYTTDSFNVEPIVDKDAFDLFIRGKVNINHVRNYSSQKKYFVERNDTEKIINELNEGLQLAIIHSDLGNGKTCIVNSLISKLVDKGHVFKLLRINDSFSEELEMASEYKGKKYIIIEDYNLYIKDIREFRLHKNKDLKLILTARSLINDIFYIQLVNSLQIDENEIGLYEVNKLEESEVYSLVEIMDEYKMWGVDSTLSRNAKKKLLRDFDSKFQNILMGLLESEQIGNEVKRIMKAITSNPTAEDIVIMSLINDILSLNLELDDMVYLLDKVTLSANITRNPDLGELINISQNCITVKSSVFAMYILKSNSYSCKIIELLIRLMSNADKVKTDKYSQVMKMLVTFSNVRLVLKDKGADFVNCVIRYYENIKNLEFNSKNPHFWLQYAIARLELKHFKEAQIYFNNAYAFGRDKSEDFDSYQIDTHYSRYLLERQIFEGERDEAFSVFQQAHTLIIGNRNKSENLHYPLRQTKHYYEFYTKFFNDFSDSEKALFMFSCKQVLDKIEAYNNAIFRLKRRKHPEVAYTERKLKEIIKDINSKELPCRNSDNKQ